PLRRGRQLLPLVRGREPGADDHGERAEGGRAPEGAAALKRALLVMAAASVLAADAAAQPLVTSVDSVTIVVGDLDRSVAFYSDVLTFSKVREYESSGEVWERLEGVFPVRLRGARMRLGSEEIDLVEFLAPEGRPIPPDARSNDRTFQHIAIIVSDMEAAYARLRASRVR